ncbi:permease-like cell division protein FtsX [Catellatospora sichuanensis]|uniref:permease-like cell division protein FtsX n=1 Tax=Catellatospora sichuanensis TaxID=1969805 RepID=UPI0011824D8B|nr:permease-like cell division protein FtsX [Catellatospora sichuanensis]
MGPRWVALIVAALLAVAGCGAPAAQTPEPRPAPQTVTVRLELAMDATAPQRTALESWLRTRPEVVSFTFENREQALARFRAAYRDSADLVGSLNAADLPESFAVTLAAGADVDGFVTAAQPLEGLDHVARDSDEPPPG